MVALKKVLILFLQMVPRNITRSTMNTRDVLSSGTESSPLPVQANPILPNRKTTAPARKIPEVQLNTKYETAASMK